MLSANRAFGQSDGTIPFTSAGIRSIVGKNVCQFEGAKFLAGVGVALDLGKQYAVEDRENDNDSVVGVFLIQKPTLRCGIVDASLDLTRLARKGEAPEFKCYTAHEGGTTWPKWGHIIGLADNDNGLKRFVKARLAWRVDVKEKRFEELKGQSVTCDTAGYDD
ncbi:MAG: hypothetical protein WBE21_12020 [Candidatus Acidiferrales bacterium]